MVNSGIDAQNAYLGSAMKQCPPERRTRYISATARRRWGSTVKRRDAIKTSKLLSVWGRSRTFSLWKRQLPRPRAFLFSRAHLSWLGD